MGTTTTNYSLYKPAIDEQDWGALMNASQDAIDAQMKVNADAIAVNVTAIGLNKRTERQAEPTTRILIRALSAERHQHLPERTFQASQQLPF